MVCWRTGIKTLWILAAGPWSLALQRILSPDCKQATYHFFVCASAQPMFPLYLIVSLAISIWQRSTKPEPFWHSLPEYREFDQPWDSVSLLCCHGYLTFYIYYVSWGKKRSHFCSLCVLYSLLQNNNINGLIPAEIGKLRNLKTLDLSSNHLSGEIPSSVGHLENLQYLWVQFCSTVLY